MPKLYDTIGKGRYVEIAKAVGVTVPAPAPERPKVTSKQRREARDAMHRIAGSGK